MSGHSSVTPYMPRVFSSRSGVLWGLAGVTAFSFTVPFTRVAVETMSPLFIGSGRAVIAAVLAAAALALTRQSRPSPRQWVRLAIVASGVVVGFPLLTSFALVSSSANHGAVVIGVLPAATAALAVLRGGEHPSRSFWVFAALGAVAAITFASMQGGGLGHASWSDLALVAAVLAAAIGYAEGGLLARELGAWQTVSWALVLAAPLTTALTAVSIVVEPPTGGAAEWLSFGYLAVVSMFLGFFAWYRGLAIGPMAHVSQVQLAQPVLSIVWAAAILREHITVPTLLGGAAVILFAGLAVRVRAGSPARPRAAA
ncbi:DMT family transporter [Marisediminicola sp. LYQ134]|uniref:DMT family transporter n=1 Tax=Marisediminicola sp. LYQ134 TaxID=3391061 RepID=UPI003982DBB4